MTTTNEHKRSRNVLSIEDKLKIITRLETGETGSSLARIYNVGRATIFDIKKRKDEILSYAAKFDSEDGSKKRKTMKKPNDERLEEAVYQWLQEMRRDGEHITGPIVCKKALELNQLLQGSTEFKASSGWLNNFKSRRGIKDFEVPEPAIIVVPPEEVFKESFMKMVKDEGFFDDDVYVVNETNLHWKSLPCRLVESQNETLNTNLEMNKEYITLMLCANTNAEHVLPLLIIGQSENTTLFEDKKYLQMRYKVHKNCVLSDIFLEWFSQEFIPCVKIKRQENGKVGKVLLVIGNSPSYPSLEKLNSVDDTFIVRFIPPYVLPLFHPTDKNILVNFKRLYKKQTLYYLLQQNLDPDNVIDLLKNFTISECCSTLMDTWSLLTQSNVTINTDDNMEEILSFLQQIPVSFEYTLDDVKAWLNDDYGNQMLTEEELDANVQVTSPDVLVVECKKEEESVSVPTNEEALSALETALAWCQQQSECSSKDLLVLKKLKNLATKKLDQS